MLRRQRQIRTQVHQFLDAGLFAFAYLLAHCLRSQWPNQYFPNTPAIEHFGSYLSLYLIIIPFAPLLLESQGFYNRPLLASWRQTIWPLLKACVWSVVGVILLLFILRIQLARSVIILFGGISFLLVFAKEEIIRIWSHTKLGLEQIRTRVILVGTPEDTVRLEGELKKGATEDIEIVARVNLNEESIDRLTDLLHEHAANSVILSAQHTLFGQIEKAIEVCELEGVEVWLLADFFKTQVSHVLLDDFRGRPTLVFRSTPEASWQGLAKQAVDLVLATAMLIGLSPLLLLVGVLIKLTSQGPILFRQQRAGLNGRPFTMLKFRTMSSDAEQHRHELEALNEMKGPVFKLSNDPRITSVGRWLRRYSIDELPQLWNVLRAEMSLVGPRPLPVSEVKRFDDLAHRRRLSVKPGLTCLWQISGRNNVQDFKEWVRLDLEYIDNWSLWLDFKILLRTIPVVFSGEGAK